MSVTGFSLEFVFASGEKHSPKAEPNEAFKKRRGHGGGQPDGAV